MLLTSPVNRPARLRPSPIADAAPLPKTSLTALYRDAPSTLFRTFREMVLGPTSDQKVNKILDPKTNPNVVEGTWIIAESILLPNEDAEVLCL